MAAKFYIEKERAAAYDAVIGVFDELFKELKDLGKKKPDATLSASKVKIINRILSDVSAFIKGESSHKYLDLLDDEALPQYSDAILVLSQYEGALKMFRDKYYGYQSHLHGEDWFIRDR